MKIVIVDTTNHADEIGGGHLILPHILEGLCQKGHEVHLVIKQEPNKILAPLLDASGAIIHKGPWKGALIEDITREFGAWINKMSPDIYLISASWDIGWTVLPLLNPEIATLTISHNDSDTFYFPAKHYRNFLTKAIGVSEDICNKFISKSCIEKDSVEWIPYGVEVSQTPPIKFNDGPLRIIYIGRIVQEQKRIKDVFKVVKYLSSKNIDFVLNIVGDGPLMKELKATLTEDIALGKVRISGWLKNKEVIAMIRESEVFLLTSEYEGFCISLVEAIANGCVAVVSKIESGNQQLVLEGVNGFLVDVGDINGYSDKLICLSGNSEKLNEMRKEAWKIGSTYSFASMNSKYEICFEESMETARTHLRASDIKFPLMSSCKSRMPYFIRKIFSFLTANNK